MQHKKTDKLPPGLVTGRFFIAFLNLLRAAFLTPSLEYLETLDEITFCDSAVGLGTEGLVFLEGDGSGGIVEDLRFSFIRIEVT